MRAEYKRLVIAIAIVFAAVLSIVKLQNTPINGKKTVKSVKEIEFSGAKIVEVDTKKQKSITLAHTIYKTKDTFVSHGIHFVNSFKDILEAKKAVQKGEEIYFYNDVKFRRNSGFTYYTNRAIYNRHEDILSINERFKALR
ncbi:MAG: hypothetical protein JXQ76_10225, partial [Campylobacterales bacterium]|nr:hypothetical protein [Campylobacterales bacterium]